MAFTHKQQQAFTLIELLITMALFAVLAAFAIPSYQQMVQNTQIKSAADSILNGLQVARAEAVKRNTDVQFEFRTGSAWTVCISPAGGGSCPSTDGTSTIQSRVENDGSSSNVTINASAAGPYVFDGLGLLTSGAVTFSVDNSALSAADSRDLNVVVSAGGAVRSCDPALDSSGTDPRKC